MQIKNWIKTKFERNRLALFRDWRRQTLVGWKIAVPIYTLGVRMIG